MDLGFVLVTLTKSFSIMRSLGLFLEVKGKWFLFGNLFIYVD